jgi:hypothetical protein
MSSFCWTRKTGIWVLVLALGGTACTIHQKAVENKKGTSPAQQVAKTLTATEPAADKLKIQAIYGKLPLHFEANQGQSDDQVKFLSRGRGYNLYLTPTEAALTLRTKGRRDEEENPQSAILNPQSSVVRLQLLNANPDPQVVGLQELPGKVHYFTGNDPKTWRTNVPTYAKVKYENVYPGVDLVYYGNQQQLEHDFIIAPGADPSAIRLNIVDREGQPLAVTVDATGDLVIAVAGEELRLRKPLVYQEIDGGRREIAGNYLLLASPIPHSQPPTPTVGFQLAAYDSTKPLVIDPVLSYSTYLGGDLRDGVRRIAVDNAGNAYVTGFTGGHFPNSSFPLANSNAAFVAKLDPSGTTLIYSTYLDGNGVDVGTGIAVDTDGNAYVTGSTSSGDLPSTPVQPQGFAGGAYDAFVAKLSPDGSTLVYFTYLGGSTSSGGVLYQGRNADVTAEEGGEGIAVDAAGNTYVTGFTTSTDFPTKNPLPGGGGAFPVACQSIPAGLTNCPDAFVAKLTPDGTDLVYSTFLGGSLGDKAHAIAIDAAGNAYVTGHTFSDDFPTQNALQSTHSSSGSTDAFVTALDATGALIYSTYLGGAFGYENSFDIAVDVLGSAYVTGQTGSSLFPTTPQSFQPNPGGGGGFRAFVSKLAPGGAALMYSSYLGQDPGVPVTGIAGVSIAIDAFGSAYVAGVTGPGELPTVNPLQGFGGGSSDAFIAKVAPSGRALLYATYLGGNGYDYNYGIAANEAGSVLVAGETLSTDAPSPTSTFPTLGAFDTVNEQTPSCPISSCDDGFVAGLSPTPLPPPMLDPIGDKTIAEGTPLSFVVSATSGSGNELALLIDRLPTWAAFSGLQNLPQATVWEGVVTGTPNSAEAGQYSIVFEVCDTDTRQCDSEHITLTVNDTVLDTDRDGVPDTTDNSPDEFNPSQSDVDQDGVGDVTDNCPTPNASQTDSNGNGVGDVCEGQVTATVLSISPPATPSGYVSGESVKVTVAVTFEPIPALGDYYVVKPTPYNVELRLTDSNGQVVRPDQIAEGPPLSIPLDLALISTGSQTLSTEIELTDWYTRLPPDAYTIHATYLSFVKDPNVDAEGNCTADLQEQGECYAPLWMGRQPAGEIPLTVVAAGGGPVDQCPTLSGNVGGTGCPAAIEATVRLHTLDIGGAKPSKGPLMGAEVRVFDRNNAAFQDIAGKKNPPGSLYGVLFEANVGRVGACVTGSTGNCVAGVPGPGEYLVLVRYRDLGTGKTVYVGKQAAPNGFVNGVAEKDFRIMKVFKKGVFREYRGGGRIVVTGSILEIIAPESAIWEGAQSLYPFLFNADSTWTVDVCTTVPLGYEIVGVYDEHGQFHVGADCLQTIVAGEGVVVAFEVEDVGSPEPTFDATLTLTRPHGKRHTRKLKVQDIRRKSFNTELAKAKAKGGNNQ